MKVNSTMKIGKYTHTTAINSVIFFFLSVLKENPSDENLKVKVDLCLYGCFILGKNLIPCQY